MRSAVLGDVTEHMRRKSWIESSIKILPILGFADGVAATGRHTSLSQPHRSFSISPSTMSPWTVSPLSFLKTKFQRQQKAFVLLALGRKVIRIPAFTDLFWGLCAQVETSYALMALVASPSTGKSLTMSASSWSTRVLVSCPWQILGPTQTVPAFYLYCQDWGVGLCQGKTVYKWFRSHGAL